MNCGFIVFVGLYYCLRVGDVLLSSLGLWGRRNPHQHVSYTWCLSYVTFLQSRLEIFYDRGPARVVQRRSSQSSSGRYPSLDLVRSVTPMILETMPESGRKWRGWYGVSVLFRMDSRSSCLRIRRILRALSSLPRSLGTKTDCWTSQRRLLSCLPPRRCCCCWSSTEASAVASRTADTLLPCLSLLSAICSFLRA